MLRLGTGAFVLAPLGAAACYGVASVIQQVGAHRAGPASDLPSSAVDQPLPRRFGVGLVADLLRQPLFLLGLGLDAVGFLLVFVGLRHLPLFVVQAAVSSTVAITAVLGSRFLGDRLTRRQWSLVGAVVIGLTLVGSSAATGDRPGPRGLGSAVLVLGVPALGIVALAADRRSAPVPGDHRRSGALAALSGIGFGAFALAGRLIPAHHGAGALLADPVLWAAVAYAALGLGIYGAALQRGSVTAVTATAIATEALFPSAVGLLLLSDRPRPGVGLAAVAGFALTVGGALALALSKSPPADEAAVTSERFCGRS
ncbi:MAG: EamA family transporter [Actinobacteria bacterium]|nr:EamA family transporter [Actinomycetota bacterium]